MKMGSEIFHLAQHHFLVKAHLLLISFPLIVLHLLDDLSFFQEKTLYTFKVICTSHIQPKKKKKNLENINSNPPLHGG